MVDLNSGTSNSVWIFPSLAKPRALRQKTIRDAQIIRSDCELRSEVLIGGEVSAGDGGVLVGGHLVVGGGHEIQATKALHGGGVAGSHDDEVGGLASRNRLVDHDLALRAVEVLMDEGDGEDI